MPFPHNSIHPYGFRASSLARIAAWALPVCMAAGVPDALAADPLRPLSRDLVQAELVADVAAVTPGTPFRLAVRLKMAPGWHVNWINPGDAGLAPSIGWKLPAGFKAGLVQWPLPARFDTGPLTIFGYADDVLLMTDVRPPADLPAGGNLDLGADVSWLACAEECVPGSASLKLRLPVEAATRSHVDEIQAFEATEARIPRHAVVWSIRARIDQSTTIVLEIQNGSGTGAPLEGLAFFPYEPGWIENAEPQVTSVHAGPAGQPVYELRITRARIPAGDMSKVQGVLVATSSMTGGAGPSAIEIDVPVTPR